MAHVTTATVSEPSDLANITRTDFWLRPEAEIEATLARYRAEAPVTFVGEPELPPELDGLIPRGNGAWIVSRYAEILEVSRNPSIYSSASGITLLDVPAEFNEFFSSMIAMDDPRHARLRKIVSAGFTPRILGQLEASVERVAKRIVDDVCDRGEVDFVVDVAAALPLKIVCDLMGVPESLYQTVFECSNVILGARDPEYVEHIGDALTAILEAGTTLAGIMSEVAEAKKGGDGTDLTTVLMNAEVDGDTLSSADIGSFFNLLVVAGNETTRNAISWGLRYLTQNPDQRAIWTADFDGVAPTAIEEIVRLASPVTYMRRTVSQDIELGGQQLREGDKVCMFYLAANRDEDVFDDPYRFDVQRSPNNHLGFGGPGPHFCLGAHLARREINVMFRELLHRLPDIEAGEPQVLASSFIHGIKHLPASFTPQPSSA